VKAKLPGIHVGPQPGGAGFSVEHDCLWNGPGNEGQEESISGPGCRTLIQSMMYGEANSLARWTRLGALHVIDSPPYIGTPYLKRSWQLGEA
jgi:hypothetical protein